MKLDQLVSVWRPRVLKFVSTYKYLILVIAAGLILLLLPTGSNETELPDSDISETEQESVFSLEEEEERLETLLSQIEGVGRVRVLLTLEDNGEQVYAQEVTDSQEESENSSRINRTETPVLYSVSGGQEEPLVERSRSPSYRGALIVCDGGDRAEVQLKLLTSMASLLGLRSDQVTVLKMKSS